MLTMRTTKTLSKFENFPTKKYDIIYADPPWHYDNRLDSGSSAISHYPTMKVDELEKLPIPDITKEDCLLFMWTTSPTLPDAMHLGKHWGFKWATIAFVWDKQWTLPGNYTLPQCEYIFVFKHGRIPQPRGSRKIRQFLSKKRAKDKHSAKPIEFRNMIHEMFPELDKIELFSRGHSDENWDVWGNEIGKNANEIKLL